jgi:hypothetical protein
VGRGGPDIIMRKRAGERLCAAAACAVRVGAERRWDRSAFSPGQADPPHFERAGAPWEARARSNVPRRTLWWVVGGWCAQQLRITSGWLPLFGGSIYKMC